MKRSWLSILMSLTMVMVWTSCSDDALDNSGLSNDAAGKGSPKSQSNASDYNVSLTTDGYVFTYTITKNPGAKDLGHFIVDLDNCGDQSAHLAGVLYATVKADDDEEYFIDLQDSEGWGTGCSPAAVTTNFVKFDDLPKAYALELTFKLDMKYDKAASTGWLKAGTSCNTTSIEAPGCPIDECLYGLGHFFANGAEAWPNDVELGGFTYTQQDGQDLWYGGNDNNVALKAFFRYTSVVLNGALDDAPESAIDAIEAYFAGNPNRLTQANISAGLFNNSGLGDALNALNEWIDENKCE